MLCCVVLWLCVQSQHAMCCCVHTLACLWPASGPFLHSTCQHQHKSECLLACLSLCAHLVTATITLSHPIAIPHTPFRRSFSPFCPLLSSALLSTDVWLLWHPQHLWLLEAGLGDWTQQVHQPVQQVSLFVCHWHSCDLAGLSMLANCLETYPDTAASLLSMRWVVMSVSGCC